jgi:hypothetical protein
MQIVGPPRLDLKRGKYGRDKNESLAREKKRAR